MSREMTLFRQSFAVPNSGIILPEHVGLEIKVVNDRGSVYYEAQTDHLLKIDPWVRFESFREAYDHLAKYVAGRGGALPAVPPDLKLTRREAEELAYTYQPLWGQTERSSFEVCYPSPKVPGFFPFGIVPLFTDPPSKETVAKVRELGFDVRGIWLVIPEGKSRSDLYGDPVCRTEVAASVCEGANCFSSLLSGAKLMAFPAENRFAQTPAPPLR